MLTTTEIIGFIGAGLAGVAYVPQIAHLIRARCSVGISRLAFELWLLASLLTTLRAVAIRAGVFIVLGTTQIVATAIIMRYATRYKETPCPSHLPPSVRPRRPRGRASLERASALAIASRSIAGIRDTRQAGGERARAPSVHHP